jgi:hypothetical protein
MEKFFISHSTKDKSLILPILYKIKGLGGDTWVDNIEMAAGDSLIEQIQKGLIDSEKVAVMITENSILSDWVQKEMQWSLEIENGKNIVKLIPCRLDKTTIPDSIKNKLYADFSENINIGLANLLRSLNTKNHFIILKLNKNYPFEFDHLDILRQLSLIEHLNIREVNIKFLIDIDNIVNDAYKYFENLIEQKYDKETTLKLQNIRKLNLYSINLSVILEKIIKLVINNKLGTIQSLISEIIDTIQKKSFMPLYDFWIEFSRLCEDSQKNILPIELNDTLEKLKIDFKSKSNTYKDKHVIAEMNFYQCQYDDLIDLGFNSPKIPIRIRVPKKSVPNDTKEHLKLFIPLNPSKEIFLQDWNEYFVPGIVRNYVSDFHRLGEFAINHIESIGFNRNEFESFGIP